MLALLYAMYASFTFDGGQVLDVFYPFLALFLTHAAMTYSSVLGRRSPDFTDPEPSHREAPARS